MHDDMKESGLLPVLGRLLKAFNFAFQPRSHACDLVQALHVVLRMLDRLNASGSIASHCVLGAERILHKLHNALIVHLIHMSM